jgi:Tat protein secretion system quality control protein TatD with DNase activity
MTALKQIVPLSQILFETDYPYARVADEAKGLQECGVFDTNELRAVYRGNALALLPRYRS